MRVAVALALGILTLGILFSARGQEASQAIEKGRYSANALNIWESGNTIRDTAEIPSPNGLKKIVVTARPEQKWFDVHVVVGERVWKQTSPTWSAPRLLGHQTPKPSL